jgi:predicted nuclease with TOPRIM domain
MANGTEAEFFEAKVTVLCEEVTHHVEEEEKGKEGMFAQCRETDVDLKELRDRLMERKQELMQLAESEGLPPAKVAAVDVGATAGA